MTKRNLLQLTLAIIKPHIIKYPYALNNIHDMIVQENFYIVRSKREHLSQKQAEKFYEEHKEKFFYNRLVTFMSSGTSEFLILAKNNAIADWRKLMGPTKVYQAQFTAPDSIRGCFGLSDTRNATHGSDSPESVSREIEIFFPDFNIQSWYQNEEEIFRNGYVKLLKSNYIHIPVSSSS